jgi:rubredoxin
MELKKKHSMLRILSKGGILSPSTLLKILAVAGKAGNSTISFGSRQDIIFDLPKWCYDEVLNELNQLHLEYAVEAPKDKKRQNIVTSFASADIQASTQWLNSGNYTQILELFNYPHVLRVNLADPLQSMVPLFYGHLNFVASPQKHYWYLYLRMPDSNEKYMWPMLVYSTDIPALSKAIERLWLQKSNIRGEELAQELLATTALNHKKIEEPLKYTQSFSPDYEGFGRMYESPDYWMGLYWRDNKNDIPFLEELCRLSLKNGITNLAITPWKSLIIKDIKEKEVVSWMAMLGRFGITLRHSAFDLNWHLPLWNAKALKLKEYIVRNFDKKDVCVHGLTFGVSYDNEAPFSSVVIRERQMAAWIRKLGIGVTYDVLVAKNFDPNSCIYNTFEASCMKNRLPSVLEQATQTYYKQFIPKFKFQPAVSKDDLEKQMVHQCPNCKTVYFAEKGAPSMNIKPGTTFDLLPESYCCPLCETEKRNFTLVDLSKHKIA